jgi:hypothetical protein
VTPEDRAWEVVRRAFEERTPHPRPRRRPTLAVALAAIAAALAVVAAGLSASQSVRRALGVEHAAVALVRLPAPGRLLVNSSAGPWIVDRDGSKRRLGGWREASWSPHGLFEVAIRGRELAALDPKGEIRWSLERGPIRAARWSGDGYRIAYLSGSALRVVAGDGTGDRLLARRVAPVAPAWNGVSHQLLYADPRGRLHLVDVDSRRTLFVTGPAERPLALGWTAGGRLVAELTERALRVYHVRNGRLFKPIPLPPGEHRLALSPTGPAAVSADGGILLVHPQHPWIAPKQIFKGVGPFADLVWSPDGRWLLASWPAADQWVFVRLGLRSSAVERVQAVSAIGRQFHARGGVAFGGWCCASP